MRRGASESETATIQTTTCWWLTISIALRPSFPIVSIVSRCYTFFCFQSKSSWSYKWLCGGKWSNFMAIYDCFWTALKLKLGWGGEIKRQEELNGSEQVFCWLLLWRLKRGFENKSDKMLEVYEKFRKYSVAQIIWPELGLITKDVSQFWLFCPHLLWLLKYV